MRTVADVVVIGAGLAGCSIAYHLAQLKGTRVIVVEKGSVGSGMTKRSGGLVHVHYAWAAEAQLAVKSLHFFQNWKDVVGGQCGFTQTGFAVLVQGEPNATRLRDEVVSLQNVGALVELLSPEQLRAIQPSLQADELTYAAYEPEAGYMDPITATQALAARAKEMGVRFHTGTFAKMILVDRVRRVTGVDTNIGEVQALTVVVAAGPWSDRLLKPLGVKIGIQPRRMQVAFYERPAELKAGHVAVLDSTTGAFFRPHTFGLTLGGLDSSGSDSSNPDQFDESVDPEYVTCVRELVAARLPAMANARYIRGHVGLYDTSPDGHAVLDRVPGIYGLFVAAGFSGTGSALAPAVGACMKELVTDGESSTVDLSPFGFARFN